MRVKSKFEIVNNLDEFINREKGRRMAETGVNVSKMQIMGELGAFCGVGIENIKRINRNVSQPSLVVSLKIADYFDTRVENIFKIN